MIPEIIDVHLHCFVGQQDTATVLGGVDKLRKAGVRNIAVAALTNTTPSTHDIWQLIPDYVENLGNPNLHEAGDLLHFTSMTDQFIVPLIDTRNLMGDMANVLSGWIREGFKGLKGIYLADSGNDIRVTSVPDTLGITLEQYQRREWEIFSFAKSNDLPLLYHMDARKYGDFMKVLLDDFPEVRVNFAHFGISRKALSKVLDHYPNVFTDIAQMLPHIKKDPASYKDFIMHYPDRVCFASDALLYQADMIIDYIDLVKELKLPEKIEAMLFYGNPARFLGSALIN